MRINKNLLSILLSIASLIGGIWFIVSIVKERKESSAQVDHSQIKINLNKIDITIEGSDLTKQYPDSIIAKAPEQVAISINTQKGQIYFNDSKVLFGALSDSIFEIIGTPDRYKTVVSNSSTYIFDKFGFYIRTDSSKSVNCLSIYYRVGKLDISPKSIYPNRIVVDGFEISKESVVGDLIKKLGLEKHPFSKDNYFKETSSLRLLLNFDSPDQGLVNLLIESK